MDHNFISNDPLSLQFFGKLVHWLQVRLSFALHWSINDSYCFSEKTNFSNWFTFKFEKQLKVDFSINAGGQVDTSPVLSKMLQSSHSTKTISHMWKTRHHLQCWGPPPAPKFQKNAANNGTDIAKKLNVII
jgi:hypothetical protein